MSISCSMLLKKNSNINAIELYYTLENICRDENLIIEINLKEVNELDKVKLIHTNISDIPFAGNTSRQLCVDIFDEPYIYKDISFEWFDEAITFFEAIVIDYFDGNEDLLFQVVYGLLMYYPESNIWIEEDWFYTIDDLDKIRNQEFNSKWCYENPRNL